MIRSKISKIEFPSLCPVCTREPEDLVPITVWERKQADSISYGIHSELRPHDRAVTFWVSTCMEHGSKSVRTDRKKGIATIGFFILFYPILYFILLINAALHYEKPPERYIIEFVILCTLLLILLILALYGFLPRALERSLRFLQLDIVKDSVYLQLTNEDYRSAFFKLNEMHCEYVSNTHSG